MHSETNVSVLDWQSGIGLSGDNPGIAVVTPPPGASARLPYLDETIDLVVIASDDPEEIAEARRVASRCVLSLGIVGGVTQKVVVDWVNRPTGRGLSVSIVIPTFNAVEETVRCLLALEHTIPNAMEVEVIVVDDASTDETLEAASFCANRNSRVRVVRNEANVGFIDTCNRGAAQATGDILLFLNQDTEPLPGWLLPTVSLFATSDKVGVVGSKLLFPDGLVQEAGGVVFSDGSCANFGRGLASEDPLVNFVRDVDYCSGAALATRRCLFEEMGGFDTRYRPAYYEDTDYCMRVRQAGWRVLYQSGSEVIHDEGSAHGTDIRSGGKRHQVRNRHVFARRWENVLGDHPDAPEQFDLEVWHALALRDWGQ